MHYTPNTSFTIHDNEQQALSVSSVLRDNLWMYALSQFLCMQSQDSFFNPDWNDRPSARVACCKRETYENTALFVYANNKQVRPHLIDDFLLLSAHYFL